MGRRKTISDSGLLSVAREVFIESGFGASTKEIARRAGVSEGVLFQRYATKADLFFAAMVLPPADVQRLLEKHRREPNMPAVLEKLTFELLDYFRSVVPVLLPLMSHPAFSFEDFATRHPDSGMQVLRRDLTGFLAAKRSEGQIGDVDPGAAALLLIASAHSLAIFERLGAHGGRFQPEIVRRTVECLWQGLTPGSGKKSRGSPGASKRTS